jgi:hypothetical protein
MKLEQGHFNCLGREIGLSRLLKNKLKNPNDKLNSVKKFVLKEKKKLLDKFAIRDDWKLANNILLWLK